MLGAKIKDTLLAKLGSLDTVFFCRKRGGGGKNSTHPLELG